MAPKKNRWGVGPVTKKKPSKQKRSNFLLAVWVVCLGLVVITWFGGFISSTTEHGSQLIDFYFFILTMIMVYEIVVELRKPKA